MGGHMELQGVETVVRRLFTDADFRARAQQNAEAALAEYALGADERAAVTKLCGRMANGQDAGPSPRLLWF